VRHVRTRYTVINPTTYTKRLILDGQTCLVAPNASVDLELTPTQYEQIRRSPELLIAEPNRSHREVESLPDCDAFYTGMKRTIAPDGEPRPLHEALFVEIFGLRSQLALLESRVAALEAQRGENLL